MKWENLHTLLSNDPSISSNFPVNISYKGNWASLVAQWVKNLPAVQRTWVLSLGQEDALEKEVANHSSILAWTIPHREEPGRLQSMGLQRVEHDWVTITHKHKGNYTYPGATCLDESPTLSFTSWITPGKSLIPRPFSLVSSSFCDINTHTRCLESAWKQ